MKLFIVLLSIFLLLGCTINLGQQDDKKDTASDDKKTPPPQPTPSPTPSPTPTPSPLPSPQPTPQPVPTPQPQPVPIPQPPTTQPPVAQDIYINNEKLTSSQIEMLKNTYGSVAPNGRYWYDKASGLFGVEGREAAGFIYAGHDFGELSADASNGNTGVILNGRELPLIEVQFFQQVFGEVYQGRWWMDNQGYIGLEGDPTPIANLILALQQAEQQGSSDGSYYYSGSGGSGGASGGCVWINVPGVGDGPSGGASSC